MEIPHSPIDNVSSGLAIMNPNTDLMHIKAERVNRLIDVPTTAAGIIVDKSPPISRDELLYLLDSFNDLDNGNYFSSRLDQSVEEFIEELRK